LDATVTASEAPGSGSIALLVTATPSFLWDSDGVHPMARIIPDPSIPVTVLVGIQADRPQSGRVVDLDPPAQEAVPRARGIQPLRLRV
jgi:hypothetical protein